MSSLLKTFDKVIGVADPVAEILSTPKHQAGGAPEPNAPIELDDVTEQAPVSPYSVPVEDIEEEELGNTPPASVTPESREVRMSNIKKQATRIIKRIDAAQQLLLEILLDVEEIDGFKFTDDEINDILDSLPEYMEEQHIEMPAHYDLALTIVFMVIKRIKRAWVLRKNKMRLANAA